jgi:hypothetical protein
MQRGSARDFGLPSFVLCLMLGLAVRETEA